MSDLVGGKKNKREKEIVSSILSYLNEYTCTSKSNALYM